MMNPAKQDRQTTTLSGEPIIDLIDGVKIRSASTLADERGTLCEIFNPAWEFSADESAKEPAPSAASNTVFSETFREGKS